MAAADPTLKHFRLMRGVRLGINCFRFRSAKRRLTENR